MADLQLDLERGREKEMRGSHTRRNRPRKRVLTARSNERTLPAFSSRVELRSSFRTKQFRTP